MRARHIVVSAALGAAVVAALPATAGAHVHTDPERVAVATSSRVAFEFGHGCDGAPTTKVEVFLPSGVKRVDGAPPTGWKVDANTKRSVTMSGPAIADGTEFSVGLSFTAVNKGTLRFKTLQTCTTGVNRWIDKEREGQPEPEHPAPTVQVVSKKAAARPAEDHH